MISRGIYYKKYHGQKDKFGGGSVRPQSLWACKASGFGVLRMKERKKGKLRIICEDEMNKAMQKKNGKTEEGT